jgi:integrase
VSGLPPEICREWKRKGFSRLPLELAIFREPKTKAAAAAGALALIEYLKNQLKVSQVSLMAGKSSKGPTVGAWLERLTSPDDNPHAARLIAEGSPYSPGTLDMYQDNYRRYLAGDPFMSLDMNETTQEQALAFIARLGARKKKSGENLAGTRTFGIVIRFVRMAFTEYEQKNEDWRNPFGRIKAPKQRDVIVRDAIEEDEIVKLFVPGVIINPLDKAVCTAMFWAGLRRGEIWGLKVEDLNWQAQMIRIRHAWKRFNAKNRELGDPKWHKIREIIFPLDLQQAIKDLWAVNGQHSFVFSRKDGSIPSASYIKNHLPKWLEQAGIELNGRKIVPHSARHSLASALEARGVPLRYIGDMLGHTSLKTTRGYLHTVSGAINDMGAKINEMAKGQEEKDRVIV